MDVEDTHPMAGNVRIALTGDQYVELTPKQARNLAMQLLGAAASAENKPQPDWFIIRAAL